MIIGATLISNNVTSKHVPKADEDAQQTLNITKDKVTLERFVLQTRLVSKGKEEAAVDGQAILDLISQAMTKENKPINVSLDNNGWEMIIKDDSGYKWYSGMMGDKVEANGKDLGELLKQRIPFKNLILFGS